MLEKPDFLLCLYINRTKQTTNISAHTFVGIDEENMGWISEKTLLALQLLEAFIFSKKLPHLQNK